MTTAVTKVENEKGLRQLLEAMKQQMLEVLPKHLTPERMVKTALIASQKQPKLFTCTQESIITSLITASELGLDVSGTLGSGYLIPYWNSKLGANECQFQPGYRGLIDLCRRSGELSDISAEVVYSNDKFSHVKGSKPHLEHVPDYINEPGDILCFYCVAVLNDGSIHIDVMRKAEVDAVKEKALANLKFKGSSPWVLHYNEMGKKTVVKRCMKYLPCSSEKISDAVEIDNRLSGYDFDKESLPAPEQKGVAGLEERLGLNKQNPEPIEETVQELTNMITDEQKAELNRLYKALSLPGDVIAKQLKYYGVESALELTEDIATAYIMQLQLKEQEAVT